VLSRAPSDTDDVLFFFFLSFLLGCQFFSGTHAIACALFALLRPGHEVRVDMTELKQQILALLLLD
jgi:hypothetical protein